MLKKNKVVMLSTEKASHLGFITEISKKRNHLAYYITELPNILDSDNQHLYIINENDVIQENEWFLFEMNDQTKVPCRLNNGTFTNSKEKIIATTDNTLISDGVSKISNSFVEKYCSEYTKGKKIEYVNVEYSVEVISSYALNKVSNDIDWILGDKALMPNSYWLTTKDGKIENSSGSGYLLGKDIILVPKHRNDGTVIIYKVKDTFTSDEVIKMLLDYHIECFYPNPDPDGSDHEKNKERITRWFNEIF